MSSSSDRWDDDCREGVCGMPARRRIRVVAAVVTPRLLADYEQEMLAQILTTVGAAGCRVYGRLGRAEFRFLASSAADAVAEVAERLTVIADSMEVMVAAGPAAGGRPEVVTHTHNWPSDPPDPSVLDTDRAAVGSGCTEWQVL